MAVEYLYGDATPIPHTPGSAVDAGDVVVVGDECRIAHLDIAANALGSLYVPNGNAIYQAPKTVGSGHAIADGALAYWLAADSKVTYTSNSGANKVIGEAIAAAGDNDTTVQFRHTKS